MSTIQWLFHFFEIVKHRRADMKEENEIDVEVIKAALEIITDKLDIVAAVAATNPEVGDSILRHKELEKNKDKVTEEGFEELFDKLKGLAPEVVDVKFLNDGSGNLLPKVNKEEFIRKRGIFE